MAAPERVPVPLTILYSIAPPLPQISYVCFHVISELLDKRIYVHQMY